VPRTSAVYALAAMLAVGLGCAGETGGTDTKAFVGATVIDGTGSEPISDGVIVVRDGRILDVGPSAAVSIPRGAERIDVAGQFVIPGMINTHGHVGDTRGLEGGHYGEQNILRQLSLYARYGITTVFSLGGDGPAGIEVRDQQNTTDLRRGRLFLAGPVVTGDTPAAAVEMVEANAAMGVDVIKIRVDDNLGTTEKMPPEVYAAVVARAHELGLPVAAHLFYLADAKAVLEAGVDFIVHSVRDAEVDDELAQLLIAKDVCYSPTLTREVSTFVYENEPAFFSDPFFRKDADPKVLDQLRDPAYQRQVRNSASAQRYKDALVMAERNLKALSDAGVTIAMGTDTGPPARFQGYFEHMEMALMSDAGMSPKAVLESATRDAARCIGRDDIGTLEGGKWADLVVLDMNPLNDIRNARSITSVWIAGNEVPGVSGS
jgi:imidazolonepropionase-like amidohydrolase